VPKIAKIRYITYMGALKIFGRTCNDYAKGYFSLNFSWAFVSIEPCECAYKI